jgi:hypothetical protein
LSSDDKEYADELKERRMQYYSKIFSGSSE